MGGRILELPVDKLIRESKEKGREEERKEIAISLMKQGILNKDAIARALNLTESELDGLLEDN